MIFAVNYLIIILKITSSFSETYIWRHNGFYYTRIIIDCVRRNKLSQKIKSQSSSSMNSKKKIVIDEIVLIPNLWILQFKCFYSGKSVLPNICDMAIFPYHSEKYVNVKWLICNVHIPFRYGNINI